MVNTCKLTFVDFASGSNLCLCLQSCRVKSFLIDFSGFLAAVFFVLARSLTVMETHTLLYCVNSHLLSNWIYLLWRDLLLIHYIQKVTLSKMIIYKFKLHFSLIMKCLCVLNMRHISFYETHQPRLPGRESVKLLLSFFIKFRTSMTCHVGSKYCILSVDLASGLGIYFFLIQLFFYHLQLGTSCNSVMSFCWRNSQQ